MHHYTFGASNVTMTNVLIPTDFSECAHNAFNYAVEYFSDVSVNFYLLHVPLQTNTPLNDKTTTKIAAPIGSSTSRLQENLNLCRLKNTNDKHHFFGIEEQLSLIEAIRKNVSQKRINVIVMGTKNPMQNNLYSLGGKSIEIITKVKCTVLVIPNHVSFKSIRNIGFATDYTLTFKNKIVKTITETLKFQNAAIQIFEIITKQSLNYQQTENRIFLQDYLKETPHSFHTVENNLMGESIQKFVGTLQIDIIAMSAKNLNIIQQLLFKPIDFALGKKEQIPFLVIHE